MVLGGYVFTEFYPNSSSKSILIHNDTFEHYQETLKDYMHFISFPAKFARALVLINQFDTTTCIGKFCLKCSSESKDLFGSFLLRLHNN